MDRNGYIGRAPADSSVVVARQIFSPSGVTTDFTFASGYTPGYLDLYLNGAKLIEGTDYTATDTSTITVLDGGATGGDVLEGVAYKAFNLLYDRVGIQSSGTTIGNAKTLNFIGTGNTFAVNGTTIDVSIQGGGGGGSGVASTITVADESSDTTCFPVFATDATGDVEPKTGTNLTFNSSTGNLGATLLTGTLQTAAQPNITSVGTLGSLDVSGNGTLGSLDVSGNISIGGTLTYDDVTNVDSVGIITAQQGIDIKGGIGATFADDVKAFFGTDGDIQIYHSGGNNYFDAQTVGTLFLQSGMTCQIKLGSPANHLALHATHTGTVELYYNNSAKFNTTNTGINVTGNSLVSSGSSYGASSGSPAVFYGDGSNLINLPSAGLTTEAQTKTNGQTALLDLTAAQDHKVTATGTVTISCTGGLEADSHTVRIINNGTATIGFSSYFLFPSGSTPTLPSADGSISLISFTVNRVGTAGTQLLAGASVNYS